MGIEVLGYMQVAILLVLYNIRVACTDFNRYHSNLNFFSFLLTIEC